MKKKLLLVLMLIAAVVVMPRVYAADAVTLKEVKDITNEDTLQSGEETTKSLVSNEDNSVVTITYDEATFKLLAGQGEDEDERPADKAWIGFRIELPTEGAKKYELKQDGKDLVTKTNIPDDDKNLDVYYGFDAEKLAAAAKEGKNLESTFVLNLYGEDEEDDTTPVATQTIKVVVVPKGITIEDEAEEKAWNAEKYEEARPVKVTVKVMKDGKEVEVEEPLSYELVKPATLTEEQVAAIKAVLTDEDVELVGLYADAELKTEFVVTDEIEEDVTVYVAYKTKETAPVEEEKAPDTVDNAVMYIALAGASLLVAGGVAVYFKKANE